MNWIMDLIGFNNFIYIYFFKSKIDIYKIENQLYIQETGKKKSNQNKLYCPINNQLNIK